MRRLLAIALIVAGCAGTGPTPIIIYVTPAPSAAAIASLPVASPTPSSTTTAKPVATTKAAYPGDWLRQVCRTMTSLGNAFTYRDDLKTALTLNDYFAIGVAGGSIEAEGYDAMVTIKLLPYWSAAAKLKDRLTVTAKEIVDSGFAIKSGGQNYSYSDLEYGVKKYANAVDVMTATTRMFASLADRYDFDCFGQT